MSNQLQEKYQISVLSILGVVAILGILPFSVIRFLEGNIPAGIIDLSLVLGITIIVTYALRSKNIRIASAVAAVFIVSGVVLISVTNGIDSFLWVYPVFASTFFLVKPIEAVAINTVAGAALVALSDVFDTISVLSFIVTILMLLLSSFIYARNSEKQFNLLETLNTVDALTGAFNRRALSLDMEAALSKSERNGLQQLLVIFDLDYFKQVNDKHGHAVGDQVLQQLVKITKAIIRKYDKLYRFGGEEFVLLVCDLSLQQQQAFIDKLQAAIKSQLKTPDGKTVTASFGGAAWIPGTTVDSWLKRADAALYQAKAAGRDCIVFDSEPAN